MSLKTFLSSLVPHFERSRIIEDIDSLSVDLDKNLIPNYKAAQQQFQNHKFASEPGKAMEALFHLRNPRARSQTHITHSLTVHNNVQRLLSKLEELVPELFARDVTKDSLTYKKAAVLQLLSVVRFHSNYAALYLNRVLAAETAVMQNKPEAVDAHLDPVDKKFLDDNLETFLQAGRLLVQPADETVKRLGQMEDIQIMVDKINFVSTTMGSDTVDPLRLGFMAPTATSSPIYKVRSMIASYQDATYKRNQELAKSIQLRLYALKDAKAGKNDPALQQKIEYLENRLSRINQDVADHEARCAS